MRDISLDTKRGYSEHISFRLNMFIPSSTPAATWFRGPAEASATQNDHHAPSATDEPASPSRNNRADIGLVLGFTLLVLFFIISGLLFYIYRSLKAWDSSPRHHNNWTTRLQEVCLFPFVFVNHTYQPYSNTEGERRNRVFATP